jgi:hypothetical protein
LTRHHRCRSVPLSPSCRYLNCGCAKTTGGPGSRTNDPKDSPLCRPGFPGSSKWLEGRYFASSDPVRPDRCVQREHRSAVSDKSTRESEDVARLLCPQQHNPARTIPVRTGSARGSHPHQIPAWTRLDVGAPSGTSAGLIVPPKLQRHVVSHKTQNVMPVSCRYSHSRSVNNQQGALADGLKEAAHTSSRT